jgi:hypothetical protein
MTTERKNRVDRLRQLSVILLQNTNTAESLIKRVYGLDEIEADFQKFWRQSDIANEDNAMKAFSKGYQKSGRRVSGVPAKKPKSGVALYRFIKFSLSFLDNLTKPDPTSGIPEPLLMSDLWEGLMNYGQFRSKNYVTLTRANMPDDMWKSAKRKDGYLKPITPIQSPIEILGRKRWTPGLQKQLSEYRPNFKSLAIGFFQGHSLSRMDWEKSSEVLKDRDLRKLNEKLAKISTHSGVVNVSDPTNPEFHGIALPHCVQLLQNNKLSDEKGQSRVIKMMKTLPPLEKL